MFLYFIEKRRRSRSRTRSRSPKRFKRTNGVSGSNPKWKRKTGKNQEKKAPRKEEKGKKSGMDDFWHPSSFEEAFSKNFFLPQVILSITAIGLSVARLPFVHALALGGRLKHCFNEWVKIGASTWVVNVISQGYKIPFRRVPKQNKIPSNPEGSLDAFEVLVREADGLKAKGAVKACESVDGQYISSYFAVPKLRSPGKFRPILNLKRMNNSIKKYKFKMETLRHVREWLKPGAFCIGIDLKDAFPHIPISEQFWKFLRFK